MESFCENREITGSSSLCTYISSLAFTLNLYSFDLSDHCFKNNNHTSGLVEGPVFPFMN